MGGATLLSALLAVLSFLGLVQLGSGAGLRGATSGSWFGKAPLNIANELEQWLNVDKPLGKVQEHNDSERLANAPEARDVLFLDDVARLQHVARAMDTNNDTQLSIEEMQQFALAVKEKQRWTETSAAFNSVDTDGSGSVDLREMQALAFNSSWDQAVHQERRFHAADADADGQLSISEFHAFLHPETNERVFSVERDYQFAIFDADGSGRVDFQEFCKASQSHGDDDFHEEAALEDFELHDADADRHLSFDEFGRLLKGHDLLTDSIMKAVEAGDSNGDGHIHVDIELPSRLQHLLQSEFVEDFFLHEHARSHRHDEL